jgi:hypothetical protein
MRPPRARRLPLIAEAALCLLAVEGLLRSARLVTASRILRSMQRIGPGRLRSAAHARRLFAAVATASRRLPGEHRCLSQALAAQLLLGRRGVRSSLAIGVAAASAGLANAEQAAAALAVPAAGPGDAGGQRRLVAHAWLQLRGRVIFGGPVHGFLPLPPLPLAGEARRRPG